MNLLGLRELYKSGKRFDYVFFFRGSCQFSNWYISDFIIDGVKYWCVEQYMMSQKAELFGDNEIKAKIMGCSSQSQIKAYGRQIRGYDDEKWSAKREQVVFDGNYAKFTQNPKLLKYIKQQKDKILVEASPYDKIWGIGLSVERTDIDIIENPFNWRGENLLGFTLMKVRDKIISESR